MTSCMACTNLERGPCALHLTFHSRSSPEEEPTMKKSVLLSSDAKVAGWHKFKMFQLTGTLACEFSEKGRIKPMLWAKYFMVFITWGILAMFIMFFGNYYTSTVYPHLEMRDIANAQMELYHTSTTDSVALHSVITMTALSSFVMAVGLYRLSRVWPDYWHSLDDLGTIDPNVTRWLSNRIIYWVIS